MENEWKAWQEIVQILKNLGIEINDCDELANAIKKWGEELAELRIEQN